MRALVSFMASPAGRILRVVAGLGLIAYGTLGVGGNDGTIIAAVGIAPIVTGLFNICIVGPLFGCPLSGAKV